jgi:hypothetical protein
MHGKSLRTVGILFVMAVTASIAGPWAVAWAGTYVSGVLPTEFGGGFVPPDPAVLKNVQRANLEAAKLLTSVEKCFAKWAANHAQGKATGVDVCLHDAAKGVLPKYTAKIQAITARAPGLPPCYNFVAAGETISTLVRGFNPSTYCGPSPTLGPTPSPSPIPTQTAAAITGTWSGSWTLGGMVVGTVSVNLTQAGSSISGTMSVMESPCVSAGTVTGSVSGSSVAMHVLFSGGEEADLIGTMNDDQMAGTYELHTGACASAGDWVMSR